MRAARSLSRECSIPQQGVACELGCTRCFRDVHGGRLTNAWTRIDAARDLAAAPDLVAVTSAASGGQAVAFQTLGCHVGTEQSPQADTIHFHTVPSGGVCAVWVALEHVGIDQGRVLVYPGSHRWPTETPSTLGLDPPGFEVTCYESAVRQILAEHGAVPEVIAMEVGDVLVWPANLVQGGAPRLDGTTRWSQVTDYVRSGDGLELARHVEDYRHIYNAIRPHEAIGMATPVTCYLQTPPS